MQGGVNRDSQISRTWIEGTRPGANKTVKEAASESTASLSNAKAAEAKSAEPAVRASSTPAPTSTSASIASTWRNSAPMASKVSEATSEKATSINIAKAFAGSIGNPDARSAKSTEDLLARNKGSMPSLPGAPMPSLPGAPSIQMPNRPPPPPTTLGNKPLPTPPSQKVEVQPGPPQAKPAAPAQPTPTRAQPQNPLQKLESELAGAKEGLEKANAELAKLKSSISIVGQLGDYNAGLSNLRNLETKQQSQIDNLSAKIKDLNTKIEDRKTGSENVMKEVKIREELKQLEGQLTTAKNEFASQLAFDEATGGKNKEAIKDMHEGAIHDLESEIRDLKKNLDKQVAPPAASLGTASLPSSSELLNTLGAEKKDLEAQIAQEKKSLPPGEEVSEKLHNLTNRLNDVNTRLTDTRIIGDLYDQRSDLQSQVEKLKTQPDGEAKSASMKALNESLENVNTEIKTRRIINETMQTEATYLQGLKSGEGIVTRLLKDHPENEELKNMAVIWRANTQAASDFQVLIKEVSDGGKRTPSLQEMEKILSSDQFKNYFSTMAECSFRQEEFKSLYDKFKSPNLNPAFAASLDKEFENANILAVQRGPRWSMYLNDLKGVADPAIKSKLMDVSEQIVGSLKEVNARKTVKSMEDIRLMVAELKGSQKLEVNVGKEGKKSLEVTNRDAMSRIGRASRFTSAAAKSRVGGEDSREAIEFILATMERKEGDHPLVIKERAALINALKNNKWAMETRKNNADIDRKLREAATYSAKDINLVSTTKSTLPKTPPVELQAAPNTRAAVKGEALATPGAVGGAEEVTVTYNISASLGLNEIASGLKKPFNVTVDEMGNLKFHSMMTITPAEVKATAGRILDDLLEQIKDPSTHDDAAKVYVGMMESKRFLKTIEDDKGLTDKAVKIMDDLKL